MNKSLLVICFVIVAVALAQDSSRKSRLFEERIRTQDRTTAAPATVDHPEHPEEGHYEPENKKPDHTESPKTLDSGVIGSMDTLKSLARVQRDQAETFRLWASQFQVFKTDVMAFMEQTSNVLQKNDKKIKTLQRVVRKIATDIDE
ncbi:Protein CBG08118 [Caenorhabditis briggsae]|uniref:Uncharacterized protein n=2 Tax=Caenorhabditis briggsae TaxID=6238 RepID=A0AAE9FB99_CAEBR|nr:Protein CBG08118 [Caenorhabditis briggsae]ULT79451.1 hypothetical protein L3Y34_010220 [Caenorhabditis briggsae]UMM38759.1 hypothetical protein L5515_016110 [Caenorhabditis briggsae]CAP28011.1 Protein CBG08118 [Caenorhabditis briggsae]